MHTLHCLKDWHNSWSRECVNRRLDKPVYPLASLRRFLLQICYRDFYNSTKDPCHMGCTCVIFAFVSGHAGEQSVTTLFVLIINQQESAMLVHRGRVRSAAQAPWGFLPSDRPLGSAGRNHNWLCLYLSGCICCRGNWSFCSWMNVSNVLNACRIMYSWKRSVLLYWQHETWHF